MVKATPMMIENILISVELRKYQKSKDNHLTLRSLKFKKEISKNQKTPMTVNQINNQINKINQQISNIQT